MLSHILRYHRRSGISFNQVLLCVLFWSLDIENQNEPFSSRLPSHFKYASLGLSMNGKGLVVADKSAETEVFLKRSLWNSLDSFRRVQWSRCSLVDVGAYVGGELSLTTATYLAMPGGLSQELFHQKFLLSFCVDELGSRWYHLLQPSHLPESPEFSKNLKLP